MRDPERIDRICELLRQTWHTVPDLRLGQLVVNLLGNDPFYVEDDTTEQVLEYVSEKGIK